MSTQPLDQLTSWLDQARQRGAWHICLLAGEPVIYRGIPAEGRSTTERSDGDVLTAEDLQRLAEAIFGAERIASLGRDLGILQARVRLSDGTFASIAAARAGGEVSLVARPVRSLSFDWRLLRVPESIIQAAESPNGLLIVTGPPGSGKTTTAYAIIDHLNATRPVHIVTVGYGLEYVVEPKLAVVQERQVGVDVPDMLAGIQSAILQAADVIFVGEVRDLEVFQGCLRAAEMDCLVITQLHLPTPGTAIERMIALQPEETRPVVSQSLSHVLRGVLCQRLLPTPAGRQIASYGVLLPSQEVGKSILQGGQGLDELCDPRLEVDIHRLRDEGKITPEAAEEALSNLAAHGSSD